MKPPRVRRSSHLLSAAREAAPWAFEAREDMPSSISEDAISETSPAPGPGVLSADPDLDLVRREAGEADLQAAHVDGLLPLGELDPLARDLDGDGVVVRADQLGLDAEDAGAGLDAPLVGHRAGVQAAGDVVGAAAGEQRGAQHRGGEQGGGAR